MNARKRFLEPFSPVSHKAPRMRTRHLASWTLACLLAAAAARAAEKKPPLPPLPDVRAIVRQRGRAVVRVESYEGYVSGLLRRAGRLLNPFPLRRTLSDAASFAFFVPAIVIPSLRKHIGSGVLIDAEGHLLTNHHVIRDADRVRVQLTDAKGVKRSFRGCIVGSDDQADIALVHLRWATSRHTRDRHPAGHRPRRNAPLVFAPLGDSEELRRGDWVVAIGNPLNLTGSATTGIVSGLHRQIGAHSLEDHIQVEAALNPGNSGGPLLNTRGEVVGIVSLGVFPSNSIGFAVPTSLFEPFLDDFKKHGRPRRGYLGVTLRDITPELAKEEKLGVETGVFVADAEWLSPAWRAGIRDGDILAAYAGKTPKNARDVQMAVLRTRPGTEVGVRVRRRGKEITCRVEVGQRRRPFRIF